MRYDEIFKELPKMFGIADAILIIGFDSNGENNNKIPCRVLQKYAERRT